MKTRARSRFLALALFVSACTGLLQASILVPTNAPAARYIIGLSPFLDQRVKDDVFRQIVGFVLEGMPVDSSLGIYDAYQLQTIASLSIPDVAAFRSGKTRANQFKEPIGKLRRFLAAEPPRPSNAGLVLDQAVRLPQFLDFVSANLLAAGTPTTVILLGSPLYLDSKEPGFSMVEGYFPSDGHLRVGRDQSVFGIKDRAGHLRGVTVHFGYFGDPWVSEIHQEKIRRFWTLFLQGQAGRLATFCGDLPTVFSAARKGEASPEPNRPLELNPSQTKLEMLRITRDVGLTDWITQDAPANVARNPPTKRIGPMKIGIRWQGSLDLDLYAKPTSEAETLFFDHVRSPEGYYFKDHRSSPRREFEFIEFESAVDVSAVDARVNFYAGEAPAGATGEVRIEFDGQIYSGRFSLPARQGNEGRTRTGQAAYWTRIDVPAVLGLPSSSSD